MNVEKVTVETWVYTKSNGDKVPVTEMESTHLLNAYRKAIIEDENKVESVLFQEIKRRMNQHER